VNAAPEGEDAGEDTGGAAGHLMARLWLISFVDLMALMLTFFILLFAMSQVRGDTWPLLADGLRGSAGATARERAGIAAAPEDTLRPGLAPGYVAALVAQHASDGPALSALTVEGVPGGVRLWLPMGARDDIDAARALAELLDRLPNGGVLVGRAAADAVDPWGFGLAAAERYAALLRRVGYAKPLPILASGAIGSGRLEFEIGPAEAGGD